jgi:insulysin
MRAKLLVVLLTAATALRPSLRMSAQLPATDPLRRRLFQGAAAVVAFRAYEAPAAQAASRVLCEAFATPATDAKAYRLIELASGARALLVQDPRAEKCAAAVDVHVGHLSDPPDRPGLAHFCEHMLFLGNAAYPGEDEWEAWISRAGGSSNAFTDTEDTCYFFELPDPAKIGNALERWGPFFSAPRFAADATRREVEAIDSEHSKNLKSDGFRLFQLTKARFPATHPFSKFGTGTRKTLRPPDGTGEPPVAQLREFYARNYVGSNMACVVCSTQSLDVLQKEVEQGLRDVKNGGPRNPPSTLYFEEAPVPQDTDAYVVGSLQSQRELSIQWVLPYDRSGPDNAFKDRVEKRYARDDLFLSHILGHEGPQSLLADLRRRGLATSLGAGSGEDTDQFRTFDISVDLTLKGLREWRTVLDMVRGVVRALPEGAWPAHTFEEPARMASIGFKWGEIPDVASLATALAGKLQVVGWGADKDLSDLLVLDRTPRAMSLEQRKRHVLETLAVMNTMTPLVTVVAPEDEVKRAAKGSPKVEAIYKTPYFPEKLPATVTPSVAAFPAPNPYVPAMDPKPKVAKKARPSLTDFGPPVKLLEADGATLWHRQDNIFGVPRAAVLVLLRTEVTGSKSASDAIHARVWTRLAQDALRDADYQTAFSSYDASLAGLDWTFGAGPRGVQLSFGGYDDKLPELARAVTGALKAFDAIAYALKDNSAALERVLDGARRDIRAARAAPASSKCVEELGVLTERPKFPLAAAEKALKETDANSLRRWLAESANVFGSVAATDVLVEGNADAAYARRIDISIREGLRSRLRYEGWAVPAEPSVLKVPLALKAPIRYAAKPAQSDESNYAALYLYQTGSGSHVRAATLVLSSVLEAPFYDALRMKRQLGYVVQAAARYWEGVSSMVFLAQSAKNDKECAGPADIVGYIEEFMDGEAPKLLDALDAAQLSDVVDGLARRLDELPKALSGAVAPHWDEIVSRRYDWDRRAREAKALRKLTVGDVRALFAATLAKDGARRRPVLVVADRGRSAKPPRADGIPDAAAWAAGLGSWDDA